MHRFIACGASRRSESSLGERPLLWGRCFECDRGVPCVGIVTEVVAVRSPGPPATNSSLRLFLPWGLSPLVRARVAAAFDDDFDEQDMQAPTPPVAQK